MMNGVLSGTMQTGAGHSFRDGVLGSDMQTGQGRSFRDGVLGAAMQTGQGHAYRDGSLGCTSGCGGALATGPGRAYRDGSLGAVVRMLADKRPMSARARRSLASKSMNGFGALGGVGLTMDLILGAAVGAGAVWFLVGRKKG